MEDRTRTGPNEKEISKEIPIVIRLHFHQLFYYLIIIYYDDYVVFSVW